MTALAERLAVAPSPTLADLGGLDIVLAQGRAVAEGIYADRLVEAIATDDQPHSVELMDIAINVLARNPIPIVLAAAAQHFASAALQPAEVKRAQQVLLSRAEMRDTHLCAELASEALAGALLLAHRDGGSRLAVAALLDGVGAFEEPTLVRRAAKLAGMAWLWRRSDDLKDILLRLATSDDAGEQALYELALIELEDALCQSTVEAMLDKLRQAVTGFTAALASDPELIEAEAMLHALSAVIQFCDSEDSKIVERSIAAACRAATDRACELDTASLRLWLRSGVAAEIAWIELAAALRDLSDRLDERSWLRAVPVLQQLGALREALLPFASRSGDQLRHAVTQRIATGIAAHEGLRAHLLAWENDRASEANDRDQAREILRAVEESRHRPGNDAELTATAVPLSPVDNVETAASLLEALQALGLATSLTGLSERLFLTITGEIEAHTDVCGEVRDDARILLAHLIHFLVYCLEVTPSMANGLFDFLFERNGDKPLEIELQRSLWTSLRLQLHGFPQHVIIREAPDIGAGRADIAVVRPTWRPVIEIKRELVDASRNGIRKYLGQAASYALTGPRLSFLVVLDLCSQREWTLALEDNCWVETVESLDDSVFRSVVVLRIPGARKTPSKIATPGGSGSRHRP
ncbi:hypothetical protein [Sphingosinicella sp.]|uniref:hypothetical protein n=1 Tax=Sphingosinicella sp. TaxID=1917971 RepID=UPI0026137011|nr:hypothetical protein [Sphingosinicella sp.]